MINLFHQTELGMVFFFTPITNGDPKNVYKANEKVFINNRNKIQMGIKRNIWPSIFRIVDKPV